MRIFTSTSRHPTPRASVPGRPFRFVGLVAGDDDVAPWRANPKAVALPIRAASGHECRCPREQVEANTASGSTLLGCIKRSPHSSPVIPWDGHGRTLARVHPRLRPIKDMIILRRQERLPGRDRRPAPHPPHGRVSPELDEQALSGGLRHSRFRAVFLTALTICLRKSPPPTMIFFPK